ncbi:Asp-tRNA(Asn)/Glu-tRNA(Gln) amidotransferase subunit GatB [Candidatus Nanohalobium constans]|uniref:Aspartyl/glutamyl-tRNA(Asn/Gln) amidotransferase subunit B n=1 Tax=Candidatus Nanohalobium constans TaxID=2565781 RepID=A0A5Q0UFV9_9ARCH|nr:Asp-tRNA(Asn)/Glu-tRNA(Gln) amidotransferase subunit GatB [Candidatus Nanohalobium constans]QGA80477.1 aspartyl-tRNA(Asn)/glutamyl-tRNA(Gln) amidotransferase subunit B [Candidatus Nanohalobium constans]
MSEEETDVMIGLETHIQLDTETKLFCGCPNEEAEEPNTHVCPTCLGHPGSKPRLNKKVLEHAVKTSQALQCDVNEEVFFSRKTYFYPDLSKDYQITQYEVPVAEDGEVEIKVGDEKKDIGITRLHIEEDPAKTRHKGGDIGNSDYTLVDYNRSGTPLLEIVTEPDFTSPKEARAYLQQLAQMLEYLEIYYPESNFALKSDANISIDGGQRVEVKNITGTAGIEKALSYEISRQKQLKKRGREVSQQTRSYNQNQEITEKLREKETEEDYGYIFDPDLTTQELDEEFREKLRAEIPELPHEKFKRFKEEYGLKDKLVEALVSVPEMADDFERLAEEFDTNLAASWMVGELKKVLNYNEVSYDEVNVESGAPDFLYVGLRVVLSHLEAGEFNQRKAEKYLRDFVEQGLDPEKEFSIDDPKADNIDLGLNLKDYKKSGDDEITEFVKEAIDENPDAVEDYNSGDEEAVNFLVGQVMSISQGKADPKTAREKILEELE